MKTSGLALLLALLGLAPAQAQTTFTMPPPAGISVGGLQVVTSCGAANLTNGTVATAVMDLTGLFCVNATATLTFPTVGAPVPLTAIFNGINVAGTLRGLSGLSTGALFPATVAIVDASGNQITTFGGAAATSNASSGQATSSTNAATVAWLYGFNGATWDQLQVDTNKFLKTTQPALNTPLTAAAAAATNGNLLGCRYTTTIPTLTDTQQAAAQFDVNCHQFVTTTNILLPTANFTRPADTTAYTAGDMVANSTTAGSVVPMSLTVNSVSGRKVYLRRVVLKKSTTGVTAPNFRVHFYTASPTIASGDNAAYSTTLSGHFCDMDVNMLTTDIFSDGNDGIGTPNNGAECAVAPTTTTVFALIEARGAYAPGNAEVFTITQLETYEP